ncbi:MAG: hypothetical protein HKN07_09535 [Acidimicrobiia bacterium]|nr:hypothetical protein [Acidimicrobiia bacterium]NNF64486.1 hypothetical protein [Acidimicrobiia bacterium]
MKRSDSSHQSAGKPRRQRKHQTGLRVALILAVVITAIVMLVHWPIVWIPAMIAAIIYCVDHSIAAIDRRAQHESPLPPMSEEARRRATVAAEERVGVKTALAIGIGLAAIAAVIAAAFLDWKLVGVGALGIFAYLALLGLPFWVAAIEEEVETEHDQLTGESRSIH